MAPAIDPALAALFADFVAAERAEEAARKVYARALVTPVVGDPAGWTKAKNDAHEAVMSALDKVATASMAIKDYARAYVGQQSTTWLAAANEVQP